MEVDGVRVGEKAEDVMMVAARATKNAAKLFIFYSDDRYTAITKDYQYLLVSASCKKCR